MANHLSYDVLSRFVERRSTSVEDARAQRHLASCGRCRSELAWLERIRSLPQRTAELDGARTADALGDGWGNLARRAAPAPIELRDMNQTRLEVSGHWLRGGSSALIR